MTVNYGTASGDALAGSDFVASSGTLTFGPGETTKTIKILVNGDLTDEYDQGFYVNLTAASGVDHHGRSGLLHHSGQRPAAHDHDHPEGVGQGRQQEQQGVHVCRDPVGGQREGGAGELRDRQRHRHHRGQRLRRQVGHAGLLAGADQQDHSITVKGDKKKESNETFFVNLSDATNATIVGSQGIGEILNDDPR